MIYFLECSFLVDHLQVLYPDIPCKIVLKCLLQDLFHIFHCILLGGALLYLGDDTVGFVAVSLNEIVNRRYWLFWEAMYYFWAYFIDLNLNWLGVAPLEPLVLCRGVHHCWFCASGKVFSIHRSLYLVEPCQFLKVWVDYILPSFS